MHERNSFNKEIGKLVKDFVLIDYEQSLIFGEDCRSIQNKSVKKKMVFPHRAKLWEASSAWTSIFYLFWFPQQPSQKCRDRS